MRIGMQSKQATHTMPIRKHTPLLVGSGAEKALASAISNTFAYKARTAGRVLSIDDKLQLAKLQYDDGEVAYIDLSPRSNKNSGGGFYITAQLQLNPGVKAGARFRADDVLAHDPSYFSPADDGSTAYKSGVLVRCAVVALDQTYEDSLMVTEKLTRDTVALVTMSRSVSLGAKANLQKVAAVGDVVNPNSALAVFENVTDDADISALLQRVGKEFDDAIAELTKNVAAAKYSGKIVEIRTFYNRDPADLSPSLQKFIKAQEKAAEERKKAAAGAPLDEPVRVNAPVRIHRDKVAGEVVDGVLITFLIQVEDVAAPGDKFVSSSPLKGIVSRVFEKGEEPFDETDHQVDYIMSPLSIVSRMTSDAFLSLWTNSVLVDLKARVVDIYKE
jgi:DNA-directed RNA polymerase beta subunit